MYLEIETPGKKSCSKDPLDFYIHTPVQIKTCNIHGFLTKATYKQLNLKDNFSLVSWFTCATILSL